MDKVDNVVLYLAKKFTNIVDLIIHIIRYWNMAMRAYLSMIGGNLLRRKGLGFLGPTRVRAIAAPDILTGGNCHFDSQKKSATLPEFREQFRPFWCYTCVEINARIAPRRSGSLVTGLRPFNRENIYQREKMKKYGVILMQKEACRSDHVLGSTMELREIKAKNKKEAYKKAQKIMKSAFNMDCRLADITKRSIFLLKE